MTEERLEGGYQDGAVRVGDTLYRASPNGDYSHGC
jgi:hypothetical protein